MSRVENLLGAQALAVVDRLRAERVGPAPSAGSEKERAALVTLLAHPARTTSWLGGVLGLTSSGVTRLVDRLVSSGWADRSPGEDLRSRRLTLTEAGAARAEALLAGRQAAMTDVLAPLSPSERDTLEALLDKMVSGLTDDRLGALQVCRLCDRAACCGAGRPCPLQHTVTDD